MEKKGKKRQTQKGKKKIIKEELTRLETVT